MRAVGRVFVQGLVTIVPIVCTLYALWWLGGAAERGLGGLLQMGLPASLYLPGMGLVLGLLLVLAVGFVMRAWFVRHLLRGVERRLVSIPLFGSIYGSLKDLMAFVGGHEKRNVRVVTVAVGSGGMRMVGLVTCESAFAVTAAETDRAHVAVYLPMSYSLGGFMVLVPSAAVQPLAMPAEAALRTVLTAGMSAADPHAGDGDDARDPEP